MLYKRCRFYIPKRARTCPLIWDNYGGFVYLLAVNIGALSRTRMLAFVNVERRF